VLSRLKRRIGLEDSPYLLDESDLYERQQGKLVFSPLVFYKVLRLETTDTSTFILSRAIVRIVVEM
jgi:hypothetical protein